MPESNTVRVLTLIRRRFACALMDSEIRATQKLVFDFPVNLSGLKTFVSCGDVSSGRRRTWLSVGISIECSHIDIPLCPNENQK